MPGDHIIKTLEEKPVRGLGEGELAIIEAHIAGCAECLRAYDAARLADSLIHARASEAIVVSPFFKTKVMAAIREKQLSPDLPAIIKAWRAARALVSFMTAMLVVLIGLTIFSYGSDGQVQSPELLASQSVYPPELDALEEDGLANDVTAYDQMLGTMYGLEDDDGN